MVLAENGPGNLHCQIQYVREGQVSLSLFFSGYPSGNTAKAWGNKQAGTYADLLLRALIVLLEISLTTAMRVVYRPVMH